MVAKAFLDTVASETLSCTCGHETLIIKVRVLETAPKAVTGEVPPQTHDS
jgi:hypothetical protein